MDNNAEKSKLRIQSWYGFATAFIIAALRFLYFGFRYFPQLDDYIQYNSMVRLIGHNGWEIITENNLLAARPLAGIFDVFVWSNLWGGWMILAVIIMAALHAGAAMLIWRLLCRHFRLSYIFVVVFLLYPTGFEGTYWLSASARVVVGLFFAALSAWLFDRYLSNCEPRTLAQKAGSLLLIGFVNLASFGFYEQALVLSAVMMIMTALLNIRKKPVEEVADSVEVKKKRFKLSSLGGVLTAFVILLINAGLYLVVTKLVAGEGGFYSGRGDNVISYFLKWDIEGVRYYLNNAFVPVFEQLGKAFLEAPVAITSNGFIRGIKQIVSDNGWWYLALTLAMTVSVLTRFRASEATLTSDIRVYNSHINDDHPGDAELDSSKKPLGIVWLILVALVLIFAPLIPMVILTNPWISLRTTVIPSIGIALLIDGLCCAVRAIYYERVSRVRSVKVHSMVCATLCCVFTVVMMIVSVSELADYRMTKKWDDAYISAIEKALSIPANDNSVLMYGVRPEDPDVILVYGASATYLEEQNYYYNEHVHGVSESDWGTQGAYATRTGDGSRRVELLTRKLDANGNDAENPYGYPALSSRGLVVNGRVVQVTLED